MHRLSRQLVYGCRGMVCSNSPLAASVGIKVLQEAVREDPKRYAPLIQKTLVECLPLITGTLDPPDPRFITEYGHTESEIVQFAFDSLNKRLRAIGINLAA